MPFFGAGGNTRMVTFHSPGISPALWGQTDGNNPTLSAALHYRKSHRGKCPNVITPRTSPALGGKSKSTCTATYPGYSTAIPKGGGGGARIQMTGA